MSQGNLCRIHGADTSKNTKKTTSAGNLNNKTLSVQCQNTNADTLQWRIQDFPRGGAPTPESAIIFQFFAENCMKMKEFGPPGGARVPGTPPWIRQCLSLSKP